MSTISAHLEKEHAHCDALYLAAVASVAERDWRRARDKFELFVHVFERHLCMEETVVFPAFERAVGCTTGPTEAMRREHGQLRGMLVRVSIAIEHCQLVDFADHADTFRILLQQHSMKEEGILYPMADRILRGHHEELIGEMIAFSNEAACAL